MSAHPKTATPTTLERARDLDVARMSLAEICSIPASEVAEAIRSGLRATRIVRTSKGGDTTEEPDHTARLNAAELWLSYALGKPLVRQQILHVEANQDSDVDAIASMADSPAAMEQLIRLIRTSPRGEENLAAALRG